MALLLLLNPMVLQAMPDENAMAGGSPGGAPMTLQDHHPASGWFGGRTMSRSPDDTTSCTAESCTSTLSCVLHHHFFAIPWSNAPMPGLDRVAAVGYADVFQTEPARAPEPPPPRIP